MIKTSRLWKAFYTQRCTTINQRKISFLLSFSEWWEIWESSGHWHERGCRKGQYVMARYGDKGPYAVGNVRICTVTENQNEAKLGKTVSEKTKIKMRRTRRERLLSFICSQYV